MQTKLTLRLDDALIARAKTWARERGISLSEAVATFFAQLPRGTASRPLTSWTRSLSGAADNGAPPPADEAIREDHRAHLERRHG